MTCENKLTIVSARLDKVGVLREKAVPRMHRVGPTLLADTDDLRDLEITEGDGNAQRWLRCE
jgi:hypothetical protein